MKQLIYLLFCLVAYSLSIQAQTADWKQQSVNKLENFVKEQIAYESNDILKVVSYEKIDGYDIDANLVYVVEFKGVVKATVDYYKKPNNEGKIINVSTEKPKEAIKLTIGIQGGASSTGEVRAAENLPLYYEKEETEFLGKATIRKSDNGSRIEKIEITRFGKPKGVMSLERAERLQKEQAQKAEKERLDRERYEKQQLEAQQKIENERKAKNDIISKRLTVGKGKWKSDNREEFIFTVRGTVMVWQGDGIFPISLKWSLNDLELQLVGGTNVYTYKVDIDENNSDKLILKQDNKIKILTKQ